VNSSKSDRGAAFCGWGMARLHFRDAENVSHPSAAIGSPNLSNEAADIVFGLLRRAEIVQMMNVRRVSGFLGKEVIDARHGSLFALQPAERQRAGFLKRRDRVSTEIVVSVGHSWQRQVWQIVSEHLRRTARRAAHENGT
jgi:hypothetical protein